MTVARRIMHGDQVPMQDEKKLMEYDKDLYIMAKNAGMMARLEKRKKYDSLWEDEEKKEHEDPMEAADARGKHLQPDRRLCRWNRLWRQRLGKRSQSHRMV